MKIPLIGEYVHNLAENSAGEFDQYPSSLARCRNLCRIRWNWLHRLTFSFNLLILLVFPMNIFARHWAAHAAILLSFLLLNPGISECPSEYIINYPLLL